MPDNDKAFGQAVSGKRNWVNALSTTGWALAGAYFAIAAISGSIIAAVATFCCGCFAGRAFRCFIDENRKTRPVHSREDVNKSSSQGYPTMGDIHWDVITTPINEMTTSQLLAEKLRLETNIEGLGNNDKTALNGYAVFDSRIEAIVKIDKELELREGEESAEICPYCGSKKTEIIGDSAFEEIHFCHNCTSGFCKTRWIEFGEEAIFGEFWVCGTHPDRDCDEDIDGNATGYLTGKAVPFIALVRICFEPGPEGLFQVEALDRGTGSFDEDYKITHYMPLLEPEHPTLFV